MEACVCALLLHTPLLCRKWSALHSSRLQAAKLVLSDVETKLLPSAPFLSKILLNFCTSLSRSRSLSPPVQSSESCTYFRVGATSSSVSCDETFVYHPNCCVRVCIHKTNRKYSEGMIVFGNVFPVKTECPHTHPPFVLCCWSQRRDLNLPRYAMLIATNLCRVHDSR